VKILIYWSDVLFSPPPPMALQPLLGQGLLIIEASQSHSVGLLWTSDQPDAETSTWQHTTLTTDRNAKPRRGSKHAIPKSERPKTHSSDSAATGIIFQTLKRSRNIRAETSLWECSTGPEFTEKRRN
jgi:hypothetical protein